MQCMDGVVAVYLVQNKDPFLMRAHHFAYIMIGNSSADMLKAEHKAKTISPVCLYLENQWYLESQWILEMKAYMCVTYPQVSVSLH